MKEEQIEFCANTVNELLKEQVVAKAVSAFVDKPLCTLAVRVNADETLAFTKESFRGRCLNTIKHLRHVHGEGEVHAVVTQNSSYGIPFTVLFGVYGRC